MATTRDLLGLPISTVLSLGYIFAFPIRIVPQSLTMAPTRTKVGHGLAKVLGIKIQEAEPYQDEVTRGESVFSVATTETFIEEPPTTAEFIRGLTPSRRQVLDYFWSLFPFLHWISFYNVQWLIGDLVAGKVPRQSISSD